MRSTRPRDVEGIARRVLGSTAYVGSPLDDVDPALLRPNPLDDDDAYYATGGGGVYHHPAISPRPAAQPLAMPLLERVPPPRPRGGAEDGDGDDMPAEMRDILLSLSHDLPAPRTSQRGAASPPLSRRRRRLSGTSGGAAAASPPPPGVGLVRRGRQEERALSGARLRVLVVGGSELYDCLDSERAAWGVQLQQLCRRPVEVCAHVRKTRAGVAGLSAVVNDLGRTDARGFDAAVVSIGLDYAVEQRVDVAQYCVDLQSLVVTAAALCRVVVVLSPPPTRKAVANEKLAHLREAGHGVVSEHKRVLESQSQIRDGRRLSYVDLSSLFFGRDAGADPATVQRLTRDVVAERGLTRHGHGVLASYLVSVLEEVSPQRRHEAPAAAVAVSPFLGRLFEDSGGGGGGGRGRGSPPRYRAFTPTRSGGGVAAPAAATAAQPEWMGMDPAAGLVTGGVPRSVWKNIDINKSVDDIILDVSRDLNDYSIARGVLSPAASYAELTARYEPSSPSRGAVPYLCRDCGVPETAVPYCSKTGRAHAAPRAPLSTPPAGGSGLSLPPDAQQQQHPRGDYRPAAVGMNDSYEGRWSVL